MCWNIHLEEYGNMMQRKWSADSANYFMAADLDERSQCSSSRWSEVMPNSYGFLVCFNLSAKGRLFSRHLAV